MIRLQVTCDTPGCHWRASYEQHRVDAARADLEAHFDREHRPDTAEKILRDVLRALRNNVTGLDPYIQRAQALGVVLWPHP